MASFISPFRSTYRYLVCPHLPILFPYCPYRSDGHTHAHAQQRQAHESPVLFYSVVLGSIGPVLAFGVPPIRERLGYRPPEPIPTTYPSAFPPVTSHTQMLTSFVFAFFWLDWWW